MDMEEWIQISGMFSLGSSTQIIIGFDNDLVPSRHQAIVKPMMLKTTMELIKALPWEHVDIPLVMCACTQ